MLNSYARINVNLSLLIYIFRESDFILSYELSAGTNSKYYIQMSH